MQRIVRLLMVLTMWLWPVVARADEACAALGHLLLASDLMRIAAASDADLDTTYGPSIGASIRSSGSLTPDLRQRAPDKVSAIETLRDAAFAAFGFVATGQAERSTLEEVGRNVAHDARQLYVDWTCDNPEPGPAEGDLDGNAEGERDPSAGGLGQGGDVGFRAVWVALGRDNPVERAVLLGSFVTSVVLLPYLVLRDRRNKRRAERHVCTAPTSIVLEDRRIAVRFFDLSVSGARILLPQIVPPGAELMIEIAGEDLPARVARSGKGFAGVQFDRLLSREELEAQLALGQSNRLFPAKKSA